jgi:hypothetical protein
MAVLVTCPGRPYAPRMSDNRRALLRKLENVEAFPLIALQALPELRADLDAVEAEALLRARELGASLEDIADALAITRQGVAYKLKALAGNGDAPDDADEANQPEVVEGTDEVGGAEVVEATEEAEVPEIVEVTDETDEAEVADEEVVDVRAPQTEDEASQPDFRRPHTKA